MHHLPYLSQPATDKGTHFYKQVSATSPRIYQETSAMDPRTMAKGCLECMWMTGITYGVTSMKSCPLDAQVRGNRTLEEVFWSRDLLLWPWVITLQTLTSSRYRDLLADYFHPFLLEVCPDHTVIFRQNNAPYHWACVIEEWLEEHDNEVVTSSFPSNLP